MEVNKNGFDNVFKKYILAASGWVGLLAGIGWMFSVISQPIAFMCLFFASGMAAMWGHHGIAMGWFTGSESDA